MQKESPRIFLVGWLAAALVAAMLVVLFLAFRKPPSETATGKPKGGSEQPRTATPAYVNRAIWREDTPGARRGPNDPQRPSIGGNVYDTDGKPISGAVVVATTFELAGNIPSVAGTVYTDADGRFELQVADGAYQVNASREGYGPTSATVRTGDTVSLVLPKSGAIVGHVLDERKQPLRQFTIEVISVTPPSMPAPAPLSSRTVSSADGSYRVDQLPAWPVLIKATAPGYASAFSQPILVSAKETKTVDLVLPVGCTLVGRVEDKAGAPAPYVLVDAEARVIAGSAGDNSIQSGNQSQSDTDGRFRLEHVPTGTVLVRAYDGNHAVTTATIEITSCDKLAPVKVVLSQGGSITGAARTSDGKPLTGARLSVASRTVGFVVTRSDAQGTFRFDRLPAGMYRMELHHEGQRTLLNVEVKEGETLNRDITLFNRGTGEIRGRITAGGRPLPGMRLLAAASHGQDGVDTFYAVTGADGSYRFVQVPEGLYLVSVITTPTGQGTKVTAGAVVTVDLDVTPKAEPETVPADDKDDEPASQSTPAAPGAPAPVAPAAPATEPATEK